ncbi:MAG: aminotransferase class V-fold PLP-dependent enzyme [Candidatus Nanoarchaeia archaeon]
MFRNEFPILTKKVNGNQLVYFDNGATSQTPQSVINSIVKYYSTQNSNVHRGAHFLSQQATTLFENARATIAEHFQVKLSECIFTRGTTNGINMLARGIEHTIKPGDEIIVSCVEHHSNFVVYQELAKHTGAVLKIVPLTQTQEFDYIAFENLVSEKTKIIALPLISNVLGEKLNTQKIKQVARYYEDAYLFYDAAQIVGHEQIDFKTLGCHALTFSAHKCYGPTGVGAIIAQEKFIKTMKPYEYGGGMIEEVTFNQSTYQTNYHKFEAGTPDICGAIAFSKAIEFIEGANLKSIQNHEQQLIEHFFKKAHTVEGLQLYGTTNSSKKGPIFAFTYKNYNCYDVATLLDMRGIALREGAHCAQPLLEVLGVQSTLRVSFAMYNTIDEIDYFFESLEIVDQMLHRG